MPHQRLIADVALEINPATGLPAYREIGVTMPRQSGKTSLLLPVEIDRCTMWGDNRRVVYTAQTGLEARKKLIEDQVPVLEKSDLAGVVTVCHKGIGNESVVFLNGSRIGLTASGQESGHGFTISMGIADECWADEDHRREQAMLPAMVTVADAQFWVASTMGTEQSTYLNRKVESGRHAVEVDSGEGIAYFEWSVPPDEDVYDEEVWWQFMPALGWTIGPAAIRHAAESMEETEFRRAYCNQQTKMEHDRIIPAALWDAVQMPNVNVDQSGSVALAIDVLPDRSWGSIVASDGQIVGLVDQKPGTGWIVERVKKLSETYSATFVVDNGGPAASVADDIEAAGCNVERYGLPDVAAACAGLYDAIADKRVTFRTDPGFDAAIVGLAKRPLGDRFIWSRQGSQSDITPIVAASLAYRAANIAAPDVQFVSFND